jgi:Zn-dependent protease/CBS domain-containing protein
LLPSTDMLQLFRFRGIPVRIDFGWLVVFGLLSWSLASGYFPQVLPELTPAAYWAQGLLAALLLFASVFLHELSHALVAQRQGVTVGGITLHVFGGVSQMESEPPTPRAEFLIAAVGPLTSFAIGALCWAVARVMPGPSWAEAIVAYLGVVNVVVGGFNLVPGFPLDGGRILRAGLWGWRGRLQWATRVASTVGSAFAALLMALGLLRIFSGEVLGGMWLILLGIFLHQAARSSWELSRMQHRLEAVRVADVMTPGPIALAGTLPLATAVDDHFRLHRVSGFPVQEGGQVVGFITWGQVERAATSASGATVRDVMSPLTPGMVVSPLDTAWSAFLKLSANRVGRVAVLDGGRLVGIVSHRDLQHALAVENVRSTLTRRAA